MRKIPQNYDNAYSETSVFEQKPIKVDDFNETEGKEIKKRVKKRKLKRREVAEQNKLKKETEKNKRKIKTIRKKCGVD